MSVREVHMKRHMNWHMNWHMTVHAKCMRPKSDNAIPCGTALCADLILFFPSTAKRARRPPKHGMSPPSCVKRARNRTKIIAGRKKS